MPKVECALTGPEAGTAHALPEPRQAMTAATSPRFSARCTTPRWDLVDAAATDKECVQRGRAAGGTLGAAVTQTAAQRPVGDPFIELFPEAAMSGSTCRPHGSNLGDHRQG